MVALLLTACERIGSSVKRPPKAENGVLNLTDWNLERDGPVDLAGEWEFYWEQLARPEDFIQGNPPSRTGFIQVPSSWNDYEVEGVRLSGDGYATYRLMILLNGSQTPLAFKMLEFETAYVLYANGQEIGANGVVEKTPQAMQPQWLPKVVDLVVEDDSLEVILQISNFHHRKGGAGQMIQFGTEQRIREIRERSLNFEFFLFGSLFIMGLYHVGLFTLRRKQTSPLYFGICCFLMALRVLVTGEYYLVRLTPDIDWELVVRLNYLSFCLVIPVFALFTRALFPRDVPNWSLRLLQLSAFVYATVIVLTPARIFTHGLLPYQIVAVIACIFYTGVVIRAAIRNREGAGIFVVGFLVLFVGMTNDILHNNQVIYTTYIGPLAIFAFIFVQTYLLARRFSRAFSEVETLSKELEQRVAARTAALMRARDEAEAANRAKSQFLANVTHDLRTPLNAILGFSQLMAQDPKLTSDQQDNLVTINRSGEHLLALINDVLALSRIGAGHVELQEKTFNLHHLLKGLSEMFRSRAEKKDLIFTLDQTPDVPQYVRADMGKLRRVLINLLDNAVKFTHEGAIALQVRVQDENITAPLLHFEVVDTGPGIASDELGAAFDAFVQTASGQRARQGTGLGLPLSRELVRLMGGELTVSSPASVPWSNEEEARGGQGTVLRFDIPVQIATVGDVQAIQPTDREDVGVEAQWAEAVEGKRIDIALSLADMPAMWLANLRQATLEGDLGWIAALIEQIHPQHADLADMLTDLADRFAHDEILELARQATENR
jgi:signal transduction histidine kinase